ncbi:MAG: class I SAM-dependent methyltransferase [Dehalococcoidales bacterium]|nr:class I SAM-dependent methyltransferase [Dehalococcoidales bacterium]
MTSIYGRLCTEYYDLSKPEAPPDALSFFLHCREDTAHPVLEPMCGTGRFLIPFLERGIDIDGTDASPDMLQACHNRCEAKGLQPVLYQQLLQEMDIPRRYGYILIPAGSFGLITDRANAAEALRRLHHHLVPGGKLVLEIETPRALTGDLGTWHESRLTRPDGTELVFSALPTYDSGEQVQQDIHRYQVISHGRVIDDEAEELSLRFYEQDEFRQLLESSGFSDIRATTPYRDADSKGEDATIVFQCRR